MAARQQRVSYAVAQQEARQDFATDVIRICAQELLGRDGRILEVAAQQSDGVFLLQRLGKLEPPWMQWRHLPLRAALETLATSLDSTREVRAHGLGQRLAREVSACRGRTGGGKPPRELALADAQALLSAADVQRLRAGEPLVLDPQPAWLAPSALREAAAELWQSLRASGVDSSAACNTGALHSSLPLLGDGFAFGDGTRRLLRLLAAVPALVEAHGWPRRLQLPPLLQLAAYSSRNGARYSPHLDNPGWEAHNRRELTILLYLNVGWDADRCGGCLRLHPEEGDPAPPVDVAPLGGRLVIFPSRTQRHEVLPCTESERLALTLWVEYADD